MKTMTYSQDAEWWNGHAGMWCINAEATLSTRTGEGWWVQAGMLAEELEGRDHPEAIAMLARVEAMMQDRRRTRR